MLERAEVCKPYSSDVRSGQPEAMPEGAEVYKSYSQSVSQLFDYDSYKLWFANTTVSQSVVRVWQLKAMPERAQVCKHYRSDVRSGQATAMPEKAGSVRRHT